MKHLIWRDIRAMKGRAHWFERFETHEGPAQRCELWVVVLLAGIHICAGAPHAARRRGATTGDV